MGLFGALFGKKKQGEKKEEKTDSDVQEVKVETKWLASEVTADQEQIDRIAQAIIEEDPFKQEYGKQLPDSKRTYKYTEVTTVNVDVRSEKGYVLFIEGQKLGQLTEEQVKEIAPYFGISLLTAYVYVIGGPYKEEGSQDEKEEPYDLEIYIQFT